jgi:tetratricopeptide (TPR) repeat protein
LESGEDEALRGRHRDWFAALCKRADASPLGKDTTAWQRQAETEYPNLRAALEWCFSGPEDMEAAFHLVEGLFWFWYFRGRRREGRQMYEAVLSRLRNSEAAPEALFAVLLGAAFFQEDSTGHICASGRARVLLEEALQVARQMGHKPHMARALYHLGQAEKSRGEFGAARAYLEETLLLNQENGGRHHIGWALSALGDIARHKGTLDEARSRYEAAQTTWRDAVPPYEYGMAHAALNLGRVARLSGDAVLARRCFIESLHRFQHRGRFIPDCLEELACLAASQGQAEGAARLFGACNTWRAANHEPLFPWDGASYEEPLRTARSSLGEVGFAAAWAEGQAMSLEQAIQYALGAVPTAHDEDGAQP